MSAGDEPPILWRAGEPPRSRRYGDFYFSRDDGLAEAREVFLAGCGLPDAWRGRRSFTVGELGFGTGLTIAALLDLWAREGPPGGHLSIFSVEADPLAAQDAARALRAWPELSSSAAALIERWPSRAPGFHRLHLPAWRASLDLAVMEAADALRAWTGAADAWFLDGFAPARNPRMWRREVLDLVAARSAPGARAATYTVAGQVRRDLAAAGFAVARMPGFGAKRQRLEAVWPGAAPGQGRPPRIAIVGGGMAAAALARAFVAQGAQPEVFADGGPGASQGPAALVAPRLDAGLGPAAALFAQAVARAGELYAGLAGAVIARGAVQLALGAKDMRRFATIAASDLFEPGALRLLTAEETSALVGEAAPPALMIAPALVIDPAPVLAAWLGAPRSAAVAAVTREAGSWGLRDAAGALFAEADVVCIAAGLASAALVAALALRPVRGQASFAAGPAPPITTLFGGYVAPAPGGILIGATHDRDDTALDARDADHGRNLAALAAVLPAQAARLDPASLTAHVGVRATTADYLPIAGQAADGLFVLTGLGSRGFTLAPLLAEHVAAAALGRASPLAAEVAALVDPGRFAARARRRGLA
jgi:tRNA 5-methylaminomethyl-2-thiouridine biosynthesis bifunctional protein